MPIMHIEQRGHGPDLVMIHGWAMHSGVFSPLADSLEAHFTLHLVDLPGHGRSSRKGARLNLDACAREIALRTPPAVWLGWSLGGAVALTAAIDQAAQVRGLVMLSSSPSFVTRPDWPHGVPHSVFTQFGDDLRDDWAGTLRRFLALEVQGSDHARDELRLLRTLLPEHGPPALSALQDGLQILDQSDLRQELATLSQPGLWIAGSRDRLVPWRSMQAAAEMQADGHYARIDGGGHAPFIGHRNAVADLIINFVDSLQ